MSSATRILFPILTPTSLPSCLLIIVNLACCLTSLSSSSTIAPEPSTALLLIFTVEILSVATIFFVPSAAITVSVSPLVPNVLESVMIPSLITNWNVVVTLSKPSGAVTSVRVYVPSLRPSNIVSLLLNVKLLSVSLSEVISSPFTFTPSRSVPVRVNSATCEASSLSSVISLPDPSIAFLLIWMVEISSVTTILLLPDSASIFELPSVTTFLFLITPLYTVNSKFVVTFWYPSGEATSVRT